MAADSSEEKLSEDYIQETVRQLCQKLENSGDDCLFLRVTDQGTACSKLGTKNALLFERTQPQLTQEFRTFCSGLYSSLGVSLKSEGDLNDEDGGSVRPETVLTTDTQADSGDGGCDEMYDTGTCCQETVLTTNKLEGGTRYIQESKDDRTAIFNSQTESGRKKSTNKKKKTNINRENTKSKLTKNNRSDEDDSTIVECAAVNTIGTQNKMDNSESRARPKRKMCTPSKLKLYETNFNKSSENSSGAKNNTSTPIEKSVRAVKRKVTKSCPKESLDKESKDHQGEGERRTSLGKKSKKSEMPSSGKKKSDQEMPSGGIKKTKIAIVGNDKSETPSSGNKKSDQEMPSGGNKKPKTAIGGNDKSEMPSSGNKKSEMPSSGNKKKSKLNESESVSVGDISDADDFGEYVDDDNDEDYVVEKSRSSKSKSNKFSSSGKKVGNTVTDNNILKCKKCNLVFGYRCSLNRHLRNNVCSTAGTRNTAKKVKIFKQSNTDVSQKRHLDHRIGNSAKKLKGMPGFKTEAEEEEEFEEKCMMADGKQGRRFIKCDVCGTFLLRRGMNKHLESKSCKASRERRANAVVIKTQASGNKEMLAEETSNQALKEADSDELGSSSIQTERNCHIKYETCNDVVVFKIKKENDDSDSTAVDTNNSTSSTTTTKTRNKNSYPCSTCDVVFSSKVTLNRHVMNGLCSGIKMETKSNESDGRKKLTCETCNRTFISSIAFLRHQKRHQMAASSGFTCTVCKTDFLYDWERVSHMVRYHKLNGPLDCFVCRHSFRNYAEYRCHKRYCKTTLKCEGETTMSGQSVSGDKENVFAGNTENIDCESEGNDTSDSGRGASDQGETTLGCESDINKDSTDVPPLGKVKVKLSCGTILFVKDTMIKTSFVADDDDSVATIDEGHAGTESASLKNVPTDTVASPGKVQTSFGNAETSQGKKCNSSEDKSASSAITPGDRETDDTKKLSVGTESLSGITENSSVKTVNTILEVDIICTRCHKDVRELFTEDERKHVCNICRRTYVSSFQLSKHMAAHTATKFYRCHHCDKCFTETRYLQRHLIDTHRERYSICRFCCALFISRPGLTQHLKEKHPNLGDVTCRVCFKHFPDRITCMEHEDRHYKERTRQYVCDVCGKMVNNKRTLSIHMAWHQDLRPYVCEVCNKGFRTRMNLIGHLPVHSGVKAHQCEVCGQCFTLKETLRRHKRIHNKAKKYQCKHCGLKFRSTEGLNGHLVNSHLTSQDISSLTFKVRQCDLCDKLCSSKQMYERHMTTHTGERPFHCQFCPRSFSLNTLLLRHVRTIHQRSEVHTCLMCNCQISSRSKWRRHLKTRKHREHCEEKGLMEPGEDGMVKGIHFKVSGLKNTDSVSDGHKMTCDVEETQEVQNVDYLQHIAEEVEGTGYIQQITEEVHDSGFIHQITGEVQNSDLIQQITGVVQSSNSTQDESSGYINQISQEVETVAAGQSTIMEIVYDDQSESQTAVNSIVEGRPLQNIVYLKVVS